MSKQHDFISKVVWTGNRGEGTKSYNGYDRTWDMAVDGKEVVHCSNDPLLGGDPSKYNPEDILISALSSCHMLWYLHLCSNAKVTVLSYEDNAVGIGESEPSGKGRFIKAILKPTIIITHDSDADKALQLHDEIHQYCFIARSVNFEVEYEPTILFG